MRERGQNEMTRGLETRQRAREREGEREMLTLDEGREKEDREDGFAAWGRDRENST